MQASVSLLPVMKGLFRLGIAAAGVQMCEDAVTKDVAFEVGVGRCDCCGEVGEGGCCVGGGESCGLVKCLFGMFMSQPVCSLC